MGILLPTAEVRDKESSSRADSGTEDEGQAAHAAGCAAHEINHKESFASLVKQPANRSPDYVAIVCQEHFDSQRDASLSKWSCSESSSVAGTSIG
jgi:hypothetical protein